MDQEFSKPSVARTLLNSTSQQARASVDAHLKGRTPQRQQTSATIHSRMAAAPSRAPQQAQASPGASVSSATAFSGPNPGSVAPRDASNAHDDAMTTKAANIPADGGKAQFGAARPNTGAFPEVKPAFSGPKTRFQPPAMQATLGTSAQNTTPNMAPTVCVPAQSHVGPCKNPQCAACGTVIIPSPKASYPIQERPSISINDWSIFTVKGPICSSEELDALNASRYDFPLPEMIFGKNSVRLVHEKTGAAIEFNTLDALDSLAPHADYKVAYYKEWLSTRPKAEQKEAQSKEEAGHVSGQESREPGPRARDTSGSESPALESVKPYDWTYSTNYAGSVVGMRFEPCGESIPLEKLVRQDPILFYDEAILFEDELGDNGISMYSTKVRVMGSCLLLLCRFSMRIDDVAFRIRDTRVYVDFETGLVMREYKCQEASYDELLRKVSGRSSDPKKLLRDSNWVSQNTPVISRAVERGIMPGAAA